MQSEYTFVGCVIQVVGSTVMVSISDALPSASPIIEGRLHRIGQVGSLIRFPLGLLQVFGVVTRVGSNRSASAQFSNGEWSSDIQRWLEVQLIGEALRGDEFKRGVGNFPTIDDEAHLVSSEDLKLIYSSDPVSEFKIGSLATSEVLTVSLNLDKFVCRHSAILGATGSGKSNAVASFVKSICESSKYPSAQVIIIDTHGEYSAAFKEEAKVFDLEGKYHKLRVPYWALGFNELAWVLFDRKDGNESPQELAIRDHILASKIANSSKLKAGSVQETFVTADSPIPFDLSKIWYNCYVEDNAIIQTRGDLSTIQYLRDAAGNEIKGNATKFEAPVFLPPGIGSAAPFRFASTLKYGSLLTKLAIRARDKRFEFLMAPEYDGTGRDLDDLVSEWIGHDKPVTILDLGGMPSEVVDVIVGVISRLVFEVMVWGRFLPSVGRQRPILMVFEEAHSYLPKGQSDTANGYATRAVRKIFKEGRKYGLGAMVVSQRPSDLDSTILSQCGTFVALRLSNSADQAQVRASIPESMSGISELLPALRTGEAIVVGEAIRVPSRVRLPEVMGRDHSSDPPVGSRWKAERPSSISFSRAVNNWRHQAILPTYNVMNRIPLQSSMLASYGYDEENSILELEYNDGHVYQYSTVPGEVFQQFLSAPSKGSFVAEVIKKGGYPFNRIE